jgi:hypothetical protein
MNTEVHLLIRHIHQLLRQEAFDDSVLGNSIDSETITLLEYIFAPTETARHHRITCRWTVDMSSNIHTHMNCTYYIHCILSILCTFPVSHVEASPSTSVHTCSRTCSHFTFVTTLLNILSTVLHPLLVDATGWCCHHRSLRGTVSPSG